MTSAEDPPREPDPGEVHDATRPDPGHEHRDEEDNEDDIGVFRSWRSLYVTVVLYTTALTILLYVLTRLLDYSS